MGDSGSAEVGKVGKIQITVVPEYTYDYTLPEDGWYNTVFWIALNNERSISNSRIN